MSTKYRNFSFTLNNYTPENEAYLSSLECRYLVYGREVGASGTPHLQGTVVFPHPLRLSAAIKTLPGAHVEVTRNLEASIAYSKKDGNFSEYGAPPSQGRRSDLQKAVDAAKSGLSLKSLRAEHPEVMCRYSAFIEQVRADNLKPSCPSIELRPWQLSLLDVLKSPPDDRSIYLLIDPVGGAGKSTFCRYLYATQDGVELFGSAKSADIACAVSEPKIALFDFSRSLDEFRPWGMVESVKNGVVFSGKYKSGVKLFSSPHVVVFTNSDIEPNKLSIDRIKRVWLSENVSESYVFKPMWTNGNKNS